MREDVGELREALRDLARRLGARLGLEHPALARNEDFQAALSQVGVDIRVVVDTRTGEIVTDYPTNVPRNS